MSNISIYGAESFSINYNCSYHSDPYISMEAMYFFAMDLADKLVNIIPGGNEVHPEPQMSPNLYYKCGDGIGVDAQRRRGTALCN